MFLRRSLASLARAYKLHVYDLFMWVHLGACPPPPPYQKAGYATVASFRSPEEWPNEDGRFRPPHSLHEIAATGPNAKRSATPRVSDRPECQPDASWQFRRPAFSRSKRLKLRPEPCSFTLKTAQARSGAPHFHVRPWSSVRSLG